MPTPPQELQAASSLLRELHDEPWALYVAVWLARVSKQWPPHLVHTATPQAAAERSDVLAVARALNGGR